MTNNRNLLITNSESSACSSQCSTATPANQTLSVEKNATVHANLVNPFINLPDYVFFGITLFTKIKYSDNDEFTIGNYLTTIDKKILAEVGSKRLLSIFKKDIQPANELIRLFLHHIAHGEETCARKMLDQYPEVLLMSGNPKEPSGLIMINVTAYEFALMRRDVDMCKMMDAYFKKLFNGEEKRARHINKVFARDRLPEQQAFQKPFSGIGQMAEAITAASPNEVTEALGLAAKIEADLALPGASRDEVFENACYIEQRNDSTLCKAFKQFRNAFEDHFLNEKYANLKHLMEAVQINDEQYMDWRSEKEILFERHVIGYLQRFIPTWLAQRFMLGNDDEEVNNASLERRKKYKGNKEWSYGRIRDLSLGVKSFAGRGFLRSDFCPYNAIRAIGGGDGDMSDLPFLQRLCRANISKLQNLTQNDIFSICSVNTPIDCSSINRHL